MASADSQTRAPAAALQPGSVVGQYRLLSRLGKGGMGEVFRALHLHLKTEVAFKVLSADPSDSARLTRFYQEMEAIGRVVDPHVVRALDAGQAGGVHYLVMELVDGVDLGRHLREHGPLAPADTAELGRQTAEGLEAIHRAGLVHRDLKPSNLLLDRRGVVKIADLGLARITRRANAEGSLTESQDVFGTADYMAPEQSRSAREVDIRADLYSLGCTLFKLTAGVAPFENDSHSSYAQIVLAHAMEPPPALSALRPEVSQELELLIAKLLAKDPNERPATPRAVAQLLASLAVDHDVEGLARTQPKLSSGQPDSLAYASTANLTPKSQTEKKTGAKAPLRSWVLGLAIVLVLGVSVVGAISLVAAAGVMYFATTDSEGDPRASLTPPEPSPTVKPVAPVEKPLPEPEPTPPVPLDDLPPLQWHPLLDRAPKKLVWPSDAGLSQLIHDPGLRQVTITSAGLGLIQFGETQSESYLLQVPIHQPRWTSGVGVFWGFREWQDAGGRRFYFAQTLQVAVAENEMGATRFVLRRGSTRTRDGGDGRLSLESLDIASADLPELQGERALRLEVRDGVLHEVKWDGRQIPELVNVRHNSRFKKEDYQGGFGASVSRGSGVFRGAEFMRQ